MAKRKRPLQPGDYFSAQPTPDPDQLEREQEREGLRQALNLQSEKMRRPRPGEVVSAQSTEDPQADERKLREFLKVAQDRFKLASEAEQHNRDEALDDIKFLSGKQWPDDIMRQRGIDGRPCLTINRLPKIISQVLNEQRQQRPSIQVNPVGDGADKDTADIFQGIVRHIEVNSDAEIAYDSAFEQMVIGGFGYYRIVTDYYDPKSWDQEILVKRIKNPFTVYFDPSAIEPDYCDARWAFIVEDVPVGEFREQYRDSAASTTLADFSSIGDQAPGWADKDSIRVAEYFHIEEEQRVMVQLDDGSVVEESQAPEDRTIIKRRNVLDRKVMWSKINAIEVLEEREWPGQWIPIIPVLGDDLDINGERYLAGLVRHAKDPQRMYNYWVSSGTEMIALAPRAPFIGAEGQFENHEAPWSQANTRNLAYLEYKPISVGMTAVPPPQRQVYEPPVQSINLMTRQADNDLKATTGIYDASLGEKGPDQSGKAILARQKQTDVATLNYSDNLARSIRSVGRQILDLVPHIYDAPRIQRIINPDQTTDQVGVFNSQHTGAEDVQQMPMMQAMKKIFDIGVGRYDVTVSVGPSYQSKRQESVASQMALIQAFPQIMPIAGDILLRNMDWPGADEIADRAKKMLPPQLQNEEDQDPEQKVITLQAQMQQISEQHEQLVQALTKAQQTIETKQQEQDTKVAIAKLTMEKDITIAEITSNNQQLNTRMKMEQDMWLQLHGSAHEVGMQAQEHGHARKLAKEKPAKQPTNGQAKQ